nr:putative integron gene cassette protein [uncultured bacterium]CAS02560.1 putative integron gene cassette protein [uncultured bacterium]
MSQASKLVTAIAVVALTGLGALAWYKTHPQLWPEFKEGQYLVAYVESYRKEHGRLPSEQEIPQRDQSGSVYYQATDSQSYQVWFGRELGESYQYDSTRGSWR